MLIEKQEAPTLALQISALSPMRILEIELGQPLPVLSAIDDKTGQCYQRALCLVRLHTCPLGTMELQLGERGLTSDEYAPQIWDAFHGQINEHLQQDSLPSVTGLSTSGLLYSETPSCIEERERFLTGAPFASVIVPTHDRPDRLELCLRSILALHYPHYEVIIVDNAPSSDATANVVQQIAQDRSEPRIYYVREDHPGPSVARNAGLVSARGEFLAFVDDDLVVDRYWLAELIRGFFQAENVACVTGETFPLELETPAQFWFEEFYHIFSWSRKSLTRRIFDLATNRPELYRPSQLGIGASMAFKATFLRGVNGFDPALGPTSLALSGEDHALFFQTIMQGYTLVREPASLAYHLYRRDYEGLQQQIHGYGVGFAAYLMKNILVSPRLLFELFIKLPYALSSLLKVRSQKNNGELAGFPKELKAVELKGMLFGAFSLVYIRSCWAVRNMPRHSSPAEAQSLRQKKGKR